MLSLRRSFQVCYRHNRLAMVSMRWSSSLPSGASYLPLPALSPTMTSGSIGKWNVQEMQAFEPGVVLCEVETDKAQVDYEAVDDGILAKILHPEGSKDIPVGTPIAVVAESQEIAEKVKGMDLSSGDSNNNKENAKPAQEEKVEKNTANILISPAAAFLLNSYGIRPADVAGSTKLPTGKVVITKADALKAVQGKTPVPISAPKPQEAKSSTPPPQQEAAQVQSSPSSSSSSSSLSEINSNYEDVPVTTMRKVIATRLTEAKQSRPHFYATMECEIDNVMAFRNELKGKLGLAPSINDMVVKAAALSLRDVPRINCRLHEDGSVTKNETIDVAVAVATPTGLITPIVKNTDRKGVLEISSDMKDLAARAKANKLKLDEFQGGSFTVSNLGMLGITEFTAVISPPQGAILAVGSGRQEFKFEHDDDTPKPVTFMTVQLSCDRRMIDEATAAQFLQCFKLYLNEPMLMNC